VQYDEMTFHPRLELIEQFDTVAHQKVKSQLTDEAGRFHGGNPVRKGLRAYGEHHNIELELNKRVIRRMTERLNQLVRGRNGGRSWYLAADRQINHAIVDGLDADIRRKMKANVSEDLVKFKEAELVDVFFGPAQAGR